MIERQEIRLAAVDAVDVPDVAALEVGLCRKIGKVYDAAQGRWVVSEPSTVVIAGHDGPGHLHFYRKEVEHGSLLPADAASAAALGATFSPAPAAPAPSRIQAPAAPKAGDSLWARSPLQ